MVRLSIEYTQGGLPPLLSRQTWYRKIIVAVQRHVSKKDPMAFAVVLVDDVKIKELHTSYLGRRRITDVLSFFYSAESTDDTASGEIFISVPQALRQAKRYRTTIEKEMARLVIHGALHVYGYDHMKTQERTVMMSLSKKIMKSIEGDLV